MKQILSTIVVCLFCLSGISQKLSTEKDYKDFFDTKTYVVKDENPMSDFNFMIQKVMPNVWDVTDYEIISIKEFEEKRRDPSYSFIVTSTVTFNKDKTKARYTFLSLLMGADVANISQMPDLCSIPLSYVRVEDDSYAYKMEGFIRFIQDHVKLVSSNPSMINSNIFKYYNKNIQSLKDKTLLLVKDDLTSETNSISKIKSVYPYNVKIVSQKEVEDAIAAEDDNVVFLHKVGPEGTKYKARCYKIVIGAADSKFYYFDYHMVTPKKRDGMLLKDFKTMGKK